MSGIALLVYGIAFAIPMYLLWRFPTHHLIWHVLAVLAAVTAGFIPVTQESKPPGFDLTFGAVVFALLVWGLGGLITRLSHWERHA